MATINVNDLTATELDQLVADAAAAKEEKAKSRVADIDSQIADLESQIADLKNERATLPGVRTRSVNVKSLKLFIVDAIRDGFDKKKSITDAVLAAGYNTTAANFGANVYQALHTGVNDGLFTKTDDHVYSVVDSVAREAEGVTEDSDD